jgi:Zn-dependent peptidase ImmA (M78 family)
MQSDLPGFPAWQENPAAMAAELSESWGIGFPANPLMRIIENNGNAISQWDFGSERIDSFSLHADGTYPLICLNQALSGDRQRFSLAYELGRILKLEDANAFAAALLMPESQVRPAFGEGISISRLEALKLQWKISMIAILYRADDLGYLTANQKRYLLQQFNALGIRRNEPARLQVKPETPTLMRHLLGRYAAKTRSGATEMAALLCLHLGEYMDIYG